METMQMTAIEKASLAVVLRRHAKGPELTREAVTGADLTDAQSELLLECFLRKGHPDLTLEDLAVELEPLRADSGWPKCSGFALEATTPSGQRARREFDIKSLCLVANRGAKRLVEFGILEKLEECYYELVEEPAARAASMPAGAGEFKLAVKTKPLRYLKFPIALLLKQAKRVGPTDAGFYPVFYTQQAFAKAERFSRKGARQTPPVETGASLVGATCGCPDSGEFFSVVIDALEVRHSEETKYSIFYSSKSWAQFDAILKGMQAAHPHMRLLGQGHGHNFLPNEGITCEACRLRDVCSATNVFASLDDRVWMNAVHTREPFALCHIFGLSARGDLLQGLFGLRDGRLQERSFYLVPDFDPKPWE